MDHLTCPTDPTPPAAALAASAADRGAVDQVPFQVAGQGVAEQFVIPVDPPIVSVKLSSRGQAPPLGAFTYIDHHLVHLGADGKPVSFSDAIGVFTAANGDAVFATHSGLVRPTLTPGVAAFEGAFVVTGGRGAFAGATGSGDFSGLADLARGEVTYSFDGTISRPR
jgi:hypothetical protein